MNLMGVVKLFTWAQRVHLVKGYLLGLLHTTLAFFFFWWLLLDAPVQWVVWEDNEQANMLQVFLPYLATSTHTH